MSIETFERPYITFFAK